MEKFPDGSNLLEFTAEAIPLLPVTGGTNGQMTGGFIFVEKGRETDTIINNMSNIDKIQEH